MTIKAIGAVVHTVRLIWNSRKRNTKMKELVVAVSQGMNQAREI
jgi:hypothetical protein